MKLRKKTVLLATLCTIISASIHAEGETSTMNRGVVRGRMLDADRQALPGATIYIKKLHAGTTSDVNGFYTLSNLLPGTYETTISYVGYSPFEAVITIQEGKTLEKDIILSEGTQLKEIVVGGAFQGQCRAINAQKNKLGITNVVSADQVGKFPDSNIGDALKRISGINVQYDQGEARFGQVRGTSPDLTSVTINGNRVPSAEGDTRSVQLDLIPADMIQTIEVNKVITPEMEADAIGGSINLVTKNSPTKRILSATAGSGWNFVSDKAQLNLGFTYGDKFFHDKLGMILSASYQNAPSGSDNTEFTWEKKEDGTAYVNDYQIRQYYVERERQSYSAALNWDVSANHKLFFKGIFNNRNDWENRYRLTLKDLDENGMGTVAVQTKGGTSNNKNARLEKQQTMDFTLSGEDLFGKLAIDWSASYAQASEDRPNERYIGFQLKKQSFSADLSDEREPSFTANEGSTLALSEKFSLKELTEQQQEIIEKDLKFALNFELPLRQGEYANKLKFGAKEIIKRKDKDIDFYEYTAIDKDAFLLATFANTASENRSGFMAGSQYKAGDFVTNDYLGNLDLNDASLFNKKQVAKKLVSNYEAREAVTAGYIRFDQKIGRTLDIMLGARVENTDIQYTGRKYDEQADAVTKTEKVKNSYLNLLPSVLMKYNVNNDFKLRASFTNTIARPKYSALVPSVNINTSDNELTVGNPELKPTLSYNFDLSSDYYFESIGLVSAGVFYKRINDFIVDQTLTNYEYQGVTYAKYHQPKNAGNANLLGMELGYQRDFGFINTALKCLGLYANYTYTYSRVSDFNFTGRENESGLSLPGSPKHTGNLSLYYEKKGLNARVSYNWASSFIDEMGTDKFYDRYYDAVAYLDANVNYTFAKRYSVYMEATNLLNQPLRYYQGTKNRTMQVEYYGMKLNLGVKVNL
ncbi:MAG: TonB-dependent receptor [Bacteroidaceae bacterium]|nr:TonB-dependent receptor [Bacteroidaceae bacterium]MBP9637356.1 TonB-dependent receptor [Bacteroidaceae bacterium]